MRPHANPLLTPYHAAVLFFALLVLTAGTYGFFCDELYFIACSKHLSFGYVDHPPLIALVTLITRKIFGESLLGLRLVAASVGAGIVLLTSILARELGGQKFSQSFAAMMILVSSAFLGICSFLSMNPFDVLLTSLFLLIMLKIFHGAPARTWIVLGIVAGVSLQNKYTLLPLGLALLLCLPFSQHRHWLKTPWPYLAAAAASLIFLPHLIWQHVNGWPTLDFMKNATAMKNVPISPIGFLVQLIVGLNPMTAPIWIGGMVYLLMGSKKHRAGVLGFTLLVFSAIYMVRDSKFYYMLPVVPLLIAAGSVWVEQLLPGVKARSALVVLLILSGLIITPLAIPLLPIETFVSYSKALGLGRQLKMHKTDSDIIPVHFHRRLGWEEMVSVVAKAYHTLPDVEKNQCAIVTDWYGSAGAIDHFGEPYGLPHALSGRNSYWFWGTGDYSGDILLTVGLEPESMAELYHEVEQIADFKYPYGERMSISICRKPRYSFDHIWKKLKVFM